METKDVRYALFAGAVASMVVSMLSWLIRYNNIGLGPEAAWANLVGLGASPVGWWFGLAAHLIFGSVIAIGYCWAFNLLDRFVNHWVVGIGLGVLHAAVFGFFLMLSPKAGSLFVELRGNTPTIQFPLVFAWVGTHMFYGVTLWTLWEEVGEERHLHRYRPSRLTRKGHEKRTYQTAK